jgi:hypothetical protein
VQEFVVVTPYTCPVRRKSKIAPSGSRICGATPADILTEVPMIGTETGEIVPEPHYTCLDCSIWIATWKLTENIKAHARANPPLIITAG